MYYLVKVENVIEIETEKGTKDKKIKEQYLVQAETVTEAESKVIAKVGGCDAVSVVLTKIIDVL